MTAGVTVDFNANLARFSTGVEKAINDLNKFENQGKRVSAGIRNAFATLGVGLSVAGFGAFIKGSIDTLDKLNDLRASTSLTIDTLTGLSFASKVSGGDLDSVAASVNKLAVNMGKDAEKFKALGVTAKDPLEAFKQLADVFVKVQDPQLRAALGAETLGKSWAGAAPLLMEGSKGIGELVEKGTRLSGITEESAKAADAFNDKMTELFGSGMLTNKMVGGLLPLLNALADDLIESRDAAKDMNDEFNPLLETGRALAVLFGNVAFVFKGVGTEIGGIAAQLAAFGRGDFAGGMAIGKIMKEDAEAARTSFDAWEKKIMGLTTANPRLGGSANRPARDAAIESAVAGVVGGKGKDKKKAGMFDPEGDALFAIDEAVRKQNRADLIRLDNEADAAREDSQKRLNAIIEATPTGQLEKAREEMVFLAKAMEDGAISETQYLEAVALHYGTAAEKLSEMDEFAKEAARGIQDAFADFLFDPFDGGIKGMLDSFSNMLRRMAAEAAAAQLSRSLFGDFGTTGNIGGLAAKGAGLLGAFFGTGYGDTAGLAAGVPQFAEGTDYVPRTGLALIHQGERIIPAAKNRAGGSGVNVVNNFTLMAPTDRRTQEQVAAMAGASIQTAMRRNR